jgi:hypothetical protein
MIPQGLEPISGDVSMSDLRSDPRCQHGGWWMREVG